MLISMQAGKGLWLLPLLQKTRLFACLGGSWGAILENERPTNGLIF
jgi:hypothetical protein